MTARLWDDGLPKGRDAVAPISIGLVAIALVMNLTISGDKSPASATAHLAGEVIAAVIAALIGLMLISISRGQGQTWLCVLGIGFTVAAVLDFAHAMVSSSAIVSALPAAETAGTWLSFLSRLALVGFAARALQLRRAGQASIERTAASLLPVVVVGLLFSGSVVVAFLNAFEELSFVPQTQFSLLTGLLFFGLFAWERGRQSASNHLNSAFAVSLLLNATADTSFMAFSSASFDYGFAGFHMFKLAAYGAMLIGILVESQSLYRSEAIARRELGRVNESLNEANLHLTTATNDLTALNEIGWIAGGSHSVEDRFGEIVDQVRSRIRAERALVVALDLESLSGWIVAIVGMKIDGRKVGTRLPLDQTLNGDVMIHRKTVMLDDSNITAAVRHDPRLQADVEAGVRSWLSVPVISEDEVVGAFLVRSVVPNAYGEREARFVEQVASHLAGSVRHSRSRRVSAA